MTHTSTWGTSTRGEESTLSTAEEETIARGRKLGPAVLMGENILNYVTQRKEGTLTMQIGKNAKYTIKIPMTPKGINVTGNIMQQLQKL